MSSRIVLGCGSTGEKLLFWLGADNDGGVDGGGTITGGLEVTSSSSIR